MSTSDDMHSCFLYGQLRDWWQGNQPDDLLLAIDVALSTLILAAVVRFSSKVAVANYQLSRKR